MLVDNEGLQDGVASDESVAATKNYILTLVQFKLKSEYRVTYFDRRHLHIHNSGLKRLLKVDTL